MANRNDLGPKVSTRTINWMDEVNRAWGSELHAPDRGVYEFGNRRKFDSTDQGLTGIYGVQVPEFILADGDPYPDMRDGFYGDIPGSPLGSQNNGFGAYDDLTADFNSLTAAADPVIAPFDPYYDFVVLLVHGDEFADKSKYARTITPQDLVTLDNTQGIFGNAASIRNGSTAPTNHLVTPSSADFACLTSGEPYTIEFWMKVVGPPPLSNSCQFMQGSNGARVFNMGNPGGPSYTDGGGSAFAAGPDLNVWHNYCVCANGQIIRWFYDGVLVNQITNSGSTSVTPTPFFDIVGTPGGSNNSMNAYFAEIRYTKGFARYGVGYSLQTAPFPNKGPN